MSTHYNRKQSEKKCYCTLSFIGLLFVCFLFGIYLNIFKDYNDSLMDSPINTSIDTIIYRKNVNIIKTMINNNSINMKKCTITNVIYPVSTPYLCSNTDYNYWDKCSCGVNCTSFAPKITIYVKLYNISNFTDKSKIKILRFLDMGSSLLFNIQNHTYFNDTCLDKKISIEYYEKIVEKFENYSSFVNSTINCLYNKNNNLIYDYENKITKTNTTHSVINETTTITSDNIIELLEHPVAIILMLCIILCLCCFVCAYCNLYN